MSVGAKETLGFCLARRPLRPCDLIGIEPAKFNQVFRYRKYGYFVDGVEATSLYEEIDGKEK
jgi:hypothetical protein